MWFKVYVVDRNSNKPSDLSKVAYIELTDRDNEKVLKVKIPLVDGMGDGTFFFPTSLRSGTYNVVAYTRWMGNFSPDFYFQQEIKLVNPFVVPAVARTARPAYDIQFFPEGGNLVTGLKNNLAFRVVGKNGKGFW
jgi:hypothetical protein